MFVFRHFITSTTPHFMFIPTSSLPCTQSSVVYATVSPILLCHMCWWSMMPYTYLWETALVLEEGVCHQTAQGTYNFCAIIMKTKTLSHKNHACCVQDKEKVFRMIESSAWQLIKMAPDYDSLPQWPSTISPIFPWQPWSRIVKCFLVLRQMNEHLVC